MSNQYIRTIEYDDFIPENEIVQFECDMEQCDYTEWVDEYPEHTLSIFGTLLNFAGGLVNEEDIIFFVNNGVDLNAVTDAYIRRYHNTTALHYACEHRHKRLIEYLIKYGADVNKSVNHTTPLECVLMGHGYHDMSDISSTEECVKILLESGATSQLRQFVLEDFCEGYLEKSEYLKFVLENATIQ